MRTGSVRRARGWIRIGVAIGLTFVSPGIFALGGPSLGSIDGVFQGLSDAERVHLSEGQPLIRTSARPGRMALVAPAESAKEMAKRFAALAPNYYAEFLFAAPAAPGALERLAGLLGDPRNFVGIPYHSRRQDKDYDLFDKMEIVGERRLGDEKVVQVLQHMEPFTSYKATYRVASSGSSLHFSFTNEEPLVYSYRNFRAAGPHEMVWELMAFEKDGWIWFYGAGGVRAFDLFGAFRSRLEDSFMGRIEAFFTFAMRSGVREKK